MKVATRMAWVILLSGLSEGAIAQTTPVPKPAEYIGDGWPFARLSEDGKGVELFCADSQATERPANFQEEDKELFVFCQGNELGKTTALLLMTDEEHPYFRKAPKYVDALVARCLDPDETPKHAEGERAIFFCTKG